MPRILLTLGVLHTLVVGEVYASPGRACHVFQQGGTIEESNDATTWVALPASNLLTAAFVRTTVADSRMILKLA